MSEYLCVTAEHVEVLSFMEFVDTIYVRKLLFYLPRSE
jgi:hypothetical protein